MFFNTTLLDQKHIIISSIVVSSSGKASSILEKGAIKSFLLHCQ